MRVYLAFYDRAGNPQKVAIAETLVALNRYLDAGFIEISAEEYERLSKTLDNVDLDELILLASALALLAGLTQRQQPIRNLPDYTAQLSRLQAVFNADAETLARQLASGEISLADWRNGMSRNISRQHLAGRILSVNGAQNLTEADRLAVQNAVQRELLYLNQFEAELAARQANGTLTPEYVAARSRLYSGAVRETYEQGRQFALGMPPLPAQPTVRTLCQRNCKCQWRIVTLQGNGNWNCYWDLGVAEHCETCIARARTFNPLQIRNGIIQPYQIQGRIYA